MEKRIEKWTFEAEDGAVHLVGYVYGHDEFPNGTKIRTQAIIGIRALSETILFANGEEMELGRANPEQESNRPNIRRWFFETMCREFGKVYLEQKLQQGRYSNV